MSVGSTASVHETVVAGRMDAYDREAFERLKYCSCYVIGPDKDGPIKIGMATDLRKRLNGLQIGCWAKLWILDLLWFPGQPVARRVEAKALDSMRAVGAHIRGEWFNEPADVGGQHLRMAAQGLGLKWFNETERRERNGWMVEKVIGKKVSATW